jgi:hypothetical protein
MARFRSKRKGKYKSGLELTFAEQATSKGLPFEYEPTRFPYRRPSHYVPDWRIAEGVYIETKGYLAPFQRQGLLAFKQEYPQVRILLLFGNSQNRLNKKSKTTYGEWATKSGFEWADIREGLPTHWWSKYGSILIDHPKNRKNRGRKR